MLNTQSAWNYKVAVYLRGLGWIWMYEWDVPWVIGMRYYYPEFFIFGEAGQA